MRRLDLYAQCNVEPRAPLDVFTAECCALCVNPGCTRSTYGNTKFESRVSNWHERLFVNVPRMRPDDERFGKISGQKFLLIDPAGSVSAPSQGWVDPRDLKPARVQVPARIEPAPPSKQAEPMPEAVPPSRAPEAPVETTRGPARPETAFVNTPVTQGQMIGGKPAPAAPEWKSPVPIVTTKEDRVVKTGAKIRIGS
jgi:hypothetical protein